MDKCCDRTTDRTPDEMREGIRDSLVFVWKLSVLKTKISGSMYKWPYCDVATKNIASTLGWRGIWTYEMREDDEKDTKPIVPI